MSWIQGNINKNQELYPRKFASRFRSQNTIPNEMHKPIYQKWINYIDLNKIKACELKLSLIFSQVIEK